ncbi:hypothetical protein FBU30_000353 [Linnemannia zychae]|nr:hypothetical protein FBU30_000353 [Linnemannia zychae]
MHTPSKLLFRQRPHRHSSSSFTPASLMAPLPFLFLILLSPQPTNSQDSPVYQPITYAASAVLADGHFYLYGGVIKLAPDREFNTGTNQFLKLDLTKSFDATKAPWTRLQGNLTYTMIQAEPSLDGQHFVTGGNRDNLGALSHIYSIQSNTWITAPAQPNITSLAGYKRSNVGMALDRSSGLMYVYGGFQWQGFSNEINVMDTTSSDARRMGWTLSFNQTTIPPLYDPMMVYLPSQNKTLVLGGCISMSPSDGIVNACLPLSDGYLLSRGESAQSLLIERQAMNAAPLPRYQSCRLTLPDGNVFIQGGKGVTEFFSDAWVLNVTDWTWKTVSIKGPMMEMARAGHSCQFGAYGQIVIVGGYNKKGALSMHVTPDIAIIDTGTWSWKSSYNGGPLDCIWPTSCPPIPGSDNGSDGSNNSNNGGSGLSAGAKGGIGAGIAVVAIAAGIFGFIYWRRRQASSSKLHAHNTTKAVSDGKSSPNGLGGSPGSGTGVPRGPAYISSQDPHVAPTGYPPQAIVEDIVEQPSPTMSTLPVYTGYSTDGIMTGDQISTLSPTSFPAMTKKHSLFGLSKQSSASKLYGSTNSPEGTAETDAALAAALLNTEETSASRNIHINHPQDMSLEQKDSIPFQQMPVNYVRAPSTKNIQYSKPQFDAKTGTYIMSSSPSSTMTSSGTDNNHAPTIHTPVKNTAPPAVRHISGPQSLVPEEEALIHRFSPGIKLQTVKVEDLDENGHYPPLTPTRSYGPTSIMVGTTSPATSRTLVTSPLQYSTAISTYSDNSNTSTQFYSDNSSPINSETIYRDSRMKKDLDSIAREIKSQTISEPKGPHAVVGASPHSNP